MNKEAAYQMIRVLKKVDSHKFNIDAYYQKYDVGSAPLTLCNLNIVCGSSACALGYAALDYWFIKKGLYAIKNTYLYYISKRMAQNIFSIKKARFDLIFGFGCSKKVLKFYTVSNLDSITPRMVIEKLQYLLDKEVRSG